MDTRNHPTLESPGSGEGRAEPLVIDETGFCKSHFLIPNHYVEDLDRILLPQGLILDRIEKIAFDIMEYYKEEEVNLICILKGSRGFFNHLMQFSNKLSTYGNSPRRGPPYLEHYVRIKSYQDTSPISNFEVIAEDLSSLRDKHVLIVEDIIDTGNTLTKFCNWLRENVQPRDIGVASLLEKRTSRSNGFKGDFVCFSVPDVFLVGFSLDYNELFRDLDHVGVLHAKAIQKYSVKSRTKDG